MQPTLTGRNRQQEVGPAGNRDREPCEEHGHPHRCADSLPISALSSGSTSLVRTRLGYRRGADRCSRCALIN